MKGIILVFAFLSFAVFRCDSDDHDIDCDLSACDPSRKTIKQVTDQVGTIGYSQEENKWVIISSPYEVTYDAQDIGIVCGDLKEGFKQVGSKVTFTGEYKEKCGNNRGPFAGQTYYYLHVSRVESLHPN